LIGECVSAAADLAEALSLAETMPETLEYAPTLLATAELCAHQGQFDRALTLATQALEHARTQDLIIEANIVVAELQLAQGDPAVADEHAAEAVARAGRLGAPRLLSRAHLISAQVAQGSDADGARAAFQVALRYAEEAGAAHEQVAVLNASADHRRAIEPTQPPPVGEPPKNPMNKACPCFASA
jgi:tetratricopeptide (TPR) repeat protein